MHSRATFLKVIGLSFLLVLCLSASPGAAKAERFALLIGVAKYGPGITQLPYDIKDVEDLRRALVNNAGYPKDHVRVMTTNLPSESPDYPSRTNIVVTLSNLRKVLNEQDSLLVYFSGHGISEQGKQYLLGADANIAALKDTGLSLDTMQENLTAIHMGQLVTIFDTCRNDPAPALPSGAGKDLSPQLSKGLEVRAYDIVKSTKVPAHMEIFACGDQERALVFGDGRQNSVFTFFFVEGIRKNAGNAQGKLSAESLFDYTTERVQQWAAQNKLQQTPFRYTSGSKSIVIADRVRSFAPAKLDFKGLDSDVVYEVKSDRFDKTTGEYGMEDETEQTQIAFRRPGYKPQVQTVSLKSASTNTVTAAAWEADNRYRLRLVLPHLEPGYQWGKLSFDAPAINLTKDNNNLPLRIPGTELNVRGTVMDFLLNKDSIKFSVTMINKLKNDASISYGPVALNGGDTYEVKIERGRFTSVKPLETVFMRTPPDPGIKIYAVPAGTPYEVTHPQGSTRVTVNGTVLESHPSGPEIELKMGLDEEKTFWILYESGGKVKRRVVRVPKSIANARLDSILSGTPRSPILEFPPLDDAATKETLDLTNLPPGAKGTVTVEDVIHPFDSSNRQIAIELESNSTDAKISIDHPDFYPEPFTVLLTSGRPVVLTNEFEVRRIGAVSIKFVSDPPGPLTIVSMDGGPPKNQPAPDTLSAKIRTVHHVTLYQPASYLLETDITVAANARTFPVHMEKHSLIVPDGVWVKRNMPADRADMIYMPADRQYKIGVAKPEAGHELEAVTAQGGYWIYAYPVTIGQYFDYSQKTGHAKPGGVAPKDWNTNSRLPMTKITAAEARAYAKSVGGDLPTEEEWEVAARGDGQDIYPWKDKWSSQKSKDLRYTADKPVGSIPQNHSAFGVADMWGHVREWTLANGGFMVRGSSFKSSGAEKTARLTWRTPEDPDTGFNDVGFRAVIKVSAAP